MKKIILGFILFLFVGLSQTFAFDVSKITYVNNTNLSSICNTITGLNFADNGNIASFGCGDEYYRFVTLGNSYDLTSITSSNSLYTGGLYVTEMKYIKNGNEFVVSGYNSYGYSQIRAIILNTPYSLDINTPSNGIDTGRYFQPMFSISDDGSYIFVNSVDYHYIYLMTTPFDLNTSVLVSDRYFQSNSSNSNNTNSYLSNDGTFILISYSYNNNNIEQYILATPYDLTSAYLVNTFDVGFGLGSLSIEDNGEKLFFIQSYTSNIYGYNTNSSFGPPVLSQPIHYQEDVEGGIKMDFVCDQDCIVEFAVYNENKVDLYGSVIGSFSGSTDTQTILLDNVSLLYGAKYYYVIVFTDLNNPGVEYFYDYTSLYWFDSTPNDYSVGDFTFTPFEFTRKNNGFSIKGLDVNIGGGVFFLNILAPNGYETGLYFTEFVRIWSNKVEQGAIGNGYGKNKTIEVLEPFHQWAGNYELTISYQYPGQGEMFPYGTNKINYAITSPGNDTAIINKNTFTCDNDGDNLVSITEGITCIPKAINYGLAKIYNFFNNIYKLIQKIGTSFTSEVKTFSFIGFASAENIIVDSVKNNVNQEAFDLTFFGKLVIFIKGFLVFMVFLIGVLVFLKLTRGKND